MVKAILTSFSILLTLLLAVSADNPQCGKDAEGALCPGGLCCSKHGFCGDTDAYCGDGCQSQCGGDDGGDDGVASIISREMFEDMLKHRNDTACPAKGFYTYDAFISAAKAFPDFGTTGNDTIRKRELAAFFGQTSHETTGGWPDAPDGPYAWGYCFIEEINPTSDYCLPSTTYPCVAGKKYFGRGPIQLSWNYNYGQCGGQLLLNDPDLVSHVPVISFETAIWFWMTPQSPKPSCHDVMTDQWTPTPDDIAAGRLPGYGITTNIINGGIECGRGENPQGKDRIGYFERYCGMLNVSTGDNLDCYNQPPFGNGLMDLVESM